MLSSHSLLGSVMGLMSLANSARALAQLTPFISQQIYRDGVRPYNLPTLDYTTAISTVNSQGTFKIAGYNLSVGPGTDATSNLTVDGWNLLVSVTTDIPLTNANASDPAHFWSNDVDESQFFDVARISLSPPDSMRSTLDSRSFEGGWSVCASLWPYGLVNDAKKAALAQSEAQFDGSCAGILSDECIRDMEMAVAKNCTDLTPPESCKLSIGFSGSAVAGSQLDNLPMGTLFEASTDPQFKGDTPSFQEVNSWVFPVAIAWSHLSKAGGDAVSTDAHMSCIRANKVLKSPNSETDGVDFLASSGPKLGAPGEVFIFALVAAAGVMLAV